MKEKECGIRRVKNEKRKKENKRTVGDMMEVEKQQRRAGSVGESGMGRWRRRGQYTSQKKKKMVGTGKIYV